MAWADVLELDFPLLSDWNGEAVDGFGVSFDGFGEGMARVARRSAFLVDEGGTVRGSWRYGVSEVPDMDELLASARALRPS